MHMFDVQAGQTRVKFLLIHTRPAAAQWEGEVSGQTDAVGGKKGDN